MDKVFTTTVYNIGVAARAWEMGHLCYEQAKKLNKPLPESLLVAMENSAEALISEANALLTFTKELREKQERD